MKKVLTAILLALVLVAPGFAPAAVEAGAGNIVLLGHIDFVARYSESDTDNGWPGYETYNTEFAVLGVAGTLGDNVDWCITHAFAFTGPYGSVNSAWPMTNNDSDGMLLDARINVHLGDALTLSAGRFIPPTSMTWNPHLMKVLHTINYPLINGSGINGGWLMPLPMYQTGVMLTGNLGPVVIQVGNFNGMGTVNDAVPPPINMNVFIPGVNNTMDIDKTKATVAKIGIVSEGFQAAGWYNGETAWMDDAAGETHDAQVAQWGIELAYTSDAFLLQGQYLSSTVDWLDDSISDDMVQNGWYVLAGVGVGPAMIVGRYDMVNYDQEELFIDGDINEETATTLGVNFMVNDNTTAGLNYTWRDVEDWDADANELALILEVNLF